MQVRDPLAWAQRQVNAYWRFLLPWSEDVRQVIHLTLLEYPEVSSKSFALGLNRNLYHLARSLGWRKKNTVEDTSRGCWEHPEITYSDTIVTGIYK